MAGPPGLTEAVCMHTTKEGAAVKAAPVCGMCATLFGGRRKRVNAKLILATRDFFADTTSCLELNPAAGTAPGELCGGIDIVRDGAASRPSAEYYLGGAYECGEPMPQCSHLRPGACTDDPIVCELPRAKKKELIL